ncbi:MAG: hypothetical protein GY694_04975 [Gammaproteobacteria bacterium]|nr:hypothetical protein [Gammaproteobacteria bacterium]
MIKQFILLLSIALLTSTGYAGDWKKDILKPLKGGALIVQNPQGKILFSHNAKKKMVPASILKIATADAFISKLGHDYRIKTEFYLTKDKFIGVKGFGDPSIVSETMTLIARELKNYLAASKVKQLNGIWLDDSFFKEKLKVHGQSNTSNPYDSSVGAIVANFNTIHIIKKKNGHILSAEPQTPLTQTAASLSKKLPPGKHRINIGNKKDQNLYYFSELLQAFLKEEGVNVPLRMKNYPIPEGLKPIYVHYSEPVTKIINQLLLYSNNFIANQLLIILGGKEKGLPANIIKGRAVVTEFLLQTIGLKDFNLQEGSGLSRKNQFTAQQMLKIVNHFAPYQHLLRLDKQRFQAKTGTLKGISSYAGFILSPKGDSYPFVIMMDKSRWGGERYKVANIMYNGLFNP